jgi:hypothetical protein
MQICPELIGQVMGIHYLPGTTGADIREADLVKGLGQAPETELEQVFDLVM